MEDRLEGHEAGARELGRNAVAGVQVKSLNCFGVKVSRRRYLDLRAKGKGYVMLGLVA